MNVESFNALPIKQVNGTVVTVGDVAHVYLGGPPQTNSVLVHGQQAVLLEVLKAGNASTLAQAAVSLIRALGGGWTVQALPDEKQTLQFTQADYGGK